MFHVITIIKNINKLTKGNKLGEFAEWMVETKGLRAHLET